MLSPKKVGGAWSAVRFFQKGGKILHGVAATPLESTVSRISIILNSHMSWFTTPKTNTSCLFFKNHQKEIQMTLPCLTSSFRYRSVEFFALNDSR